MKELIQVKNDEAVCTSLDVAEKFNKQHKHVLRDIENLLSNESKFGLVKMFDKSTYTDSKGEKRPMYYINRDGFSLLVMGFTGKKALEWKLKYIEAFNTMERVLSEKRTSNWITEREKGKLTRKSETDVLKELAEYMKEQGSEHADMVYMTYSKLANKAVGCKNRELATSQQLSELSFIENIILNQARIGMERNLHYKEIFQECKKQIELFKEVAFLK